MLRNLTGADLKINGVVIKADPLIVCSVGIPFFVMDGEVDNIPTRKMTKPTCKNLPEKVEGTFLIVPYDVCEAHKDRSDLYYPDYGSTAVRDKHGRLDQLTTLAHI